ncbi:MAG: hypothetical protein KAS32_18120, partial [Candidatus Peribacteraceae bacterium]|nr:hypothetical protein [Candidatus Peribacteraceae bacterium]
KKLKWDSSGTVVVKYATNGGNPISGTTATNDVYINTYQKTFQFYIDGSASATVDSIDLLVRRLIGKR